MTITAAVTGEDGMALATLDVSSADAGAACGM